MNAKQIFMSLIAVFALVAIVSAASSLSISPLTVKVDGVYVSSETVAGYNGGTIPVEVSFTANADASDVRVKAWFSGYRSDLEVETSRFELINGSTYHKSFDIKLPSDVDPTEDFTLHVRVESKTDYHEESFPVRMQRESYDLRVLSAEFDRSVMAGDNLAIDVVIKNRGFNRLDDNFVIVRIPELGVERKTYFGDLTPLDEKNDNGKNDAVSGRTFITIPSNAQAGIYNVEVEAFNSDSSDKFSRTIVVGGFESNSQILAPVKTLDLAKNSESSYDLMLVNAGSKIAVYEVSAESVDGLNVRVSEPTVVVGAGSSKTIKVLAMGTSVGSMNFAVNVYQDGKLVQRIPLVANVKSGSMTGTANNTVILTVVLAIVFIVLLVILIVLLTKKPSEKTEEFGESYY